MTAVLSSPSTTWMMLALSCIAFLFAVAGLSLRVQKLAARRALVSTPSVEGNEDAVLGVRRWWRRRLTLIALGVLLGTAVARTYAWGVGLDRVGPIVDVLAVGAVVGASSLSATAGTGYQGRLIGGVRVARAHATAFTDFASSRLRASARVAVATAVLLTAAIAGATVSSPRYDGFSSILVSPLIMTTLAALALLDFEVVGRLLAHRRHRAGTPQQLAGDDVVRCLVVRDTAIAALALGLASVLLTAPKLWIVLELQLLAPETLRAALGVSTVLAVGVLACAVALRPHLSADLLVNSARSGSRSARDLAVNP
jgi:hypothetical protein